MNFIILYLIKSSLSLIVLYLSYELFFRKEAYFRFSRIVLLSTLFIVIILPIIPYDAQQILSITSVPLSKLIVSSNRNWNLLQEIVVRSNGSSSFFTSNLSLRSGLLIVYFLGVLFKITQFLLRLIHLGQIIKRAETFNQDGLKFIFTYKGSPTYSFLKWIFIDPTLLNKHDTFTAIISHEKIHAEQGHTYDLIFAEMLTIILWFNPFAYFLKNTIKENHEYITDHQVITHHQDIQTYQMVLLQHSSAIKTNVLSHNFSYSLLKRRLNIMKKSKNKFGFSFRILFTASSFALVFFACSSPQEKAPKDDNPETIINVVSNGENQKVTTVPGEQVFLVVEKMPEYTGGESAMYKFIGNNINYPTEAKKEGIQGRIFVSFIVEKDGQISTIEVMRGIGGGCDEEAVRVIKSMPNWTPGQQRGIPVRVQYRMPIKFTLQ